MSNKVIITGATGMIGGIVLQHCLERNDITDVISISRKTSGLKHEKLQELIHADFTNYSGLEEHFKNVDIVYFCIGVYTGAVSRDKFREITVDYTKAFADVIKVHSPNVTFCFLSGDGADQTEKSRMMFAQDKGIAENYLLAQNFGRLHIFRPGYIYPVTPRVEPNFSYRLSRKLYPLLKVLIPNSIVDSEHLSKVIFELGLQPSDKIIFENKDIKKALGMFN